MNHDVCLVNPFRCKIIAQESELRIADRRRASTLVYTQRKRNDPALRAVDTTRVRIGARLARDARSICSSSFAGTEQILFSNQTTITAGTAFISGRTWTIAPGTMPSRPPSPAITSCRTQSNCSRNTFPFSARATGNCSRCSWTQIHFFSAEESAAPWCVSPHRRSSTSPPAEARPAFSCSEIDRELPSLSRTTIDNQFGKP